MAISTFSDLKSAVGTWLARGDLDSFVPDFISLAELRLCNDLRIRQMQSDLNVTISSGVATVPSDFLDMKHCRVDGNDYAPLEFRESVWIFQKFPLRSAESRPDYIAVDGEEFVFGPYPDAEYTIKGSYYAKPAALSISNETNVWTDETPDALLMASLCESAPFLQQDRRIMIWEEKYEAIKKRYNSTEKSKMSRNTRVSTI